MCQHVHVTLSAEDKKDVRKLAGVMIPVYASIMLAAIAVVAVASAPPKGDLVAAIATPATR
jgi:hypothetical protein